MTLYIFFKSPPPTHPLLASGFEVHALYSCLQTFKPNVDGPDIWQYDTFSSERKARSEKFLIRAASKRTPCLAESSMASRADYSSIFQSKSAKW